MHDISFNNTYGAHIALPFFTVLTSRPWLSYTHFLGSLQIQFQTTPQENSNKFQNTAMIVKDPILCHSVNKKNDKCHVLHGIREASFETTILTYCSLQRRFKARDRFTKNETHHRWRECLRVRRHHFRFYIVPPDPQFQTHPNFWRRKTTLILAQYVSCIICNHASTRSEEIKPKIS